MVDPVRFAASAVPFDNQSSPLFTLTVWCFKLAAISTNPAPFIFKIPFDIPLVVPSIPPSKEIFMPFAALRFITPKF